MTNCKYITKNGRCGLKGSYAYRHGCFGEDMCRCREPMTNADRIRAMSDEELAEFVDDIAEYVAEGHYCTGFLKVSNFPYSCLDTKECCKKHVVEWLQQPAEDDCEH